MPTGSVSCAMCRPSLEVFNVLHDYSRRLEWDTLLSSAALTRGHTVAGKGVSSLCVGKRRLGGIGIETRYVSFAPGSLAAVEMINRPAFFESFAASIRHVDTPEGSLLTYKFRFTAKPGWLRWVLEPVMLAALRLETQKRLRALAAYMATQPLKPS